MLSNSYGYTDRFGAATKIRGQVNHQLTGPYFFAATLARLSYVRDRTDLLFSVDELGSYEVMVDCLKRMNAPDELVTRYQATVELIREGKKADDKNVISKLQEWNRHDVVEKMKEYGNALSAY